MKTILSALAVAAVLSFTPALTQAGDDCGCSKKCQTNCANGHGEKCKCKTCDCAKTGKCSHGKCNLKGKEKPAADKPTEEKPAEKPAS